MAGRIGSTLSSTPAVTCIKILLTVFNFIFWISGVAILAIGVWMKLELYMYMELTDLYYSHAPWVLIGIGGGIILIASLGCCCTVKGKPALLYVYATFLVIIFIAELAFSISMFLYRGKLEEGFKTGLKDAMDKYKAGDDTEETKAIDNLQKRLMCCGSDSFSDWFTKDWDGTGASKKVPKSCCRVDEKDCKNTGLSDATDDIYTEGCNNKLTLFMQSNFGIIGGVAIGFSFLQLFGALFACCLAKNINKAKYEQVA
jgi:tetraspanin-7